MLGTSKTNPVVGPISLESTIAYALQLRAGMVEWTSGKEWSQAFGASALGSDHSGKWRTQFVDIEKTINSIEHMQQRYDVEALMGFVYLFNSEPIGVMTIFETDTHVLISNIVASPAVTDAGYALIETAVRWSERCGSSGKVTLWARTAAVRDIYARYGFAPESARGWSQWDARMALNPADSDDKWEKSVDGWSLKAKRGKLYAVSGLQLETAAVAGRDDA